MNKTSLPSLALEELCLRWVLFCIALCFASTSLPVFAGEFADESKDWGISEMSRPKGPPYNVPTPLKVPGAKTVTTDELKAMLAKDPKLVVIDALGSSAMIESAQGLGNGIGEQRMFGKDVAMFPKALETLTGGDKGKGSRKNNMTNFSCLLLARRCSSNRHGSCPA